MTEAPIAVDLATDGGRCPSKASCDRPIRCAASRAARAARERPDPRGGLRPSGAGTAGETAAGRMGRRPAQELRHRSDPGPRRPANALGSSGAAGPTPVSVSREQIASPIVVSHYRIRRARTRDRSAVVSRSADGRPGGCRRLHSPASTARAPVRRRVPRGPLRAAAPDEIRGVGGRRRSTAWPLRFRCRKVRLIGRPLMRPLDCRN